MGIGMMSHENYISQYVSGYFLVSIFAALSLNHNFWIARGFLKVVDPTLKLKCAFVERMFISIHFAPVICDPNVISLCQSAIEFTMHPCLMSFRFYVHDSIGSSVTSTRIFTTFNGPT